MSEKQMKLFEHKKEMFESPLEEKTYKALCILKKRLPIVVKPQYSITDEDEIDNRDEEWCRCLQYYDGFPDDNICYNCFGWEDEWCKFMHTNKFESRRLDFAVFLGNNKINIECDGEEFHTDFEKDEKRDKEMIKNGWKVIRLDGREIYDFKEKTLSRLIERRIHEIQIHNQAPA